METARNKFHTGPVEDMPFYRSTSGDWLFALLSLAGVSALIGVGLSSEYEARTAAIVYCGLWAFLVVRMHLHLACLGGLSAFSHLAGRLPATWVNTMVYFPIFFASKLLQFVVCEIFFFDPVGQVYKCKGAGITLQRYARMCKDLDKPLMWRKTHGMTKFAIYPHLLSTQIAANVYTLGPYTGFGVLTILFDQNHVTFRNGLFGTHPAYNYHVTLFFDNEKGEAYWHTAHGLLPGFLTVYRYLWNFYAEHMIELIEASEERDPGNAIQAPSTDYDTTWRHYPTMIGASQCEIRHNIKSSEVTSSQVKLSEVTPGPFIPSEVNSSHVN